MKLPESILLCLQRLEQAGFEAWCVGGCVRDHLLGITPHDHDLCTNATPAQLKTLFADHDLVLSGEKHGTVTVIVDHSPVEITTFRTEGGYRDGRHPDWVRFVTSLKDDLSRRDFTVNAMAWSPSRGLSDPFGGQQDLKQHILRAVGDPSARFLEDALRILRGVRFAARFGLTPDPATEEAMLRLAPAMDALARERVKAELWGFLPYATAEDLLRWERVITAVIPELKATVGFSQHNRHHLYDVYTHTAHVVENCPPDPALRMAALLHDVAKPACFTVDEKGQGHFYGHEEQSALVAGEILNRLRCSNEEKSRITHLIRRHMSLLTPERKLLRRRLSQYGEQGLRDQLALQRADRIGTGTGSLEAQEAAEACLAALLEEESCLRLKDLAVNGRDLMALGYAGREIGLCLSALLELVLEERLPNRREALLEEAVRQRKGE